MSNPSYFLPINSNSLAHYFGRAIILPGRYYINKFYDIQNTVGSALLLSTKCWVKDSDCSLELILTEGEEKGLIKISTHFYILLSPLPISRIRAVYFKNNEQGKTTAWNINNGAAFLPERLIQINDSKESDLVLENEVSNIEEFDDSVDFARKAKYFDHILGGFALMRIAGEHYMNYSQNYFSTLAFFNAQIKQDILKARSENSVKLTNDFSGLFIKSDSKWSKWQSYFYQTITIEEVERIAVQERIDIHKKLGIPQTDNIDPNSILYDLIVLATYGDSKNKSLDSFVSDVLNEKVLSNKKEELSLLVGLNNGYGALRNKYKFSVANKIVKFELISRLDYYIIESIFQYAFNSAKDNYRFNYIDNWVPELVESKPVKDAYKVIDKWVVSKKKPKAFSEEYMDELFHSSRNRDIYNSVSNAATSWLPSFLRKNEEECLKYFEAVFKESFIKWQKQLLNQLKIDHEAALSEQKEELYNQFKSEVESAQEKISLLNKEKNLLHRRFEEINQDVSMKGTIIYRQNIREDNILSDSNELNYNSLSVTKLREIAKEKHVKPIPKTKDELIQAIKSANPLI